MTQITVLLRGAACAAALCLTVAACGDDDTGSSGGGSCEDRMLAIVNSDEMVEAAEAGDELPSDLEDQLDALDEDCGDELDALDEAEMTALVDRIDPTVAAYLGEGAEQEFQEVGESISNG